MWICCEISVVILQYIISCKITLRFGNKLLLQYCEFKKKNLTVWNLWILNKNKIMIKMLSRFLFVNFEENGVCSRSAPLINHTPADLPLSIYQDPLVRSVLAKWCDWVSYCFRHVIAAGYMKRPKKAVSE